jgi:hypothetical protein
MRPLHVRLAAWGTVLVAAAIAATLRAGATEVDPGANGPQRNGTTSQGLPIWVVADGDGVREIRMVWRFRCDKGETIRPFGLTASEHVPGFERRDRGFHFADRRDLPTRSGWTAKVHVTLDGTARRGTSSAEVRFADGAERGPTCRSGPVRWATSG